MSPGRKLSMMTPKCEEKLLEFQALKQAEKCTETAESRV
jgi:hypothetical protein